MLLEVDDDGTLQRHAGVVPRHACDLRQESKLDASAERCDRSLDGGAYGRRVDGVGRELVDGLEVEDAGVVVVLACGTR